MAGTLTIHSTGNGELTDGHSWIEYRRANSVIETYGTWGNNPVGTGNGLHKNIELVRTSEAWRTASLNDEQEVRLFAKVQEYAELGASGWSLFNPCSAFAVEAWYAATGERLRHRRYFLFSNPSTLKVTLLNKP